MRFVAIAYFFAAFLTLGFPAQAQETEPGSACDPGEIHHVRQIGGPENAGASYFLICDGSNWRAAHRWDTATAKSLFQVDYDPDACTIAKDGRIRYNSTNSPHWEYCDGGADT